VVEADLSVPGVSLFVTPGDKRCGLEFCAATTSEFLEQYALQVAVNGSYFQPFHANDYTLWEYYPHQGDPVDVNGLVISNGVVYSEDEPGQARLCVSRSVAHIVNTACPADTLQALAGKWILLQDGKLTDPSDIAAIDEPKPRTAVGVDSANRKLWLIVVDGRQPGYSEGVTLAELAVLAKEVGIDDALNLDSGGSSTLVMSGNMGATVLNAPIHTRIPMRQRPVANHLGVYALSVSP
jgi:exopolysaccharide biosynthesis protein